MHKMLTSLGDKMLAQMDRDVKEGRPENFKVSDAKLDEMEKTNKRFFPNKMSASEYRALRSEAEKVKRNKGFVLTGVRTTLGG